MTINLRHDNVPTEPGYYFVMCAEYNTPAYVRVYESNGQELWWTKDEFGVMAGKLLVGCQEISRYQ